MTAQYQTQGQVAIIALNNPPVNGMNFETRRSAVEGINRALDDDQIKAIIITGAGTAFSGGADIKEFNTPMGMAEPTLHTFIDEVESSPKPVIAAIHHVCMGGGLELSLACHYRIASRDAQVALPEVKIGLLPGAGGTQRLPRAAGLEVALRMITTGSPETAENLANTGLFQKLIDGEGDAFIDAAVAFAASIADIQPLPKVRNQTVHHPNAEQLLADTKTKAQRGFLQAPVACVDAVAATLTMPFEEGIQFERQLFYKLVVGNESKALRHAFFAERAANKIADVTPNTPLRSIATAAVVGAGTMGSGIAMCFANANIPVVLIETKQENLDKGLATIRKNYQATRDKGRLSAAECEQRIALISGSIKFDDASAADVVVEAVFEDMGVKRAVFQQLDQIMKPGAILASNTSTLDLNQVASTTKRAQDVIGMHFFSPANVMKLLEIVRGEKTSVEVLATTMALSKRLKKIGVVSGVCDGFIGNRMLEKYIIQAGLLLEEGCMPEQVDAAVEKLGFAMGPFRVSDLAGNDISYAIRKRRAATRPDYVYSKIADKLCDIGRFGQKTSAGWYDYQAGERKPIPSPLVHDLIVDHSKQTGVQRREISDQEITERLIYALVNEGANILMEGIAQRASDIDIVYLSGYGFPLHLGGPMFYANTNGLPLVISAINKYAIGQFGSVWQVSPLLQSLADQGKLFK